MGEGTRLVLIGLAGSVLSFAGFDYVLSSGPLSPVRPDPRIPTFEQKMTAYELPAQPDLASGNDERTRLRRAVLDTAQAYRLSPCNKELKEQYLAAATAYSRARIEAANAGGAPETLWSTSLDKEVVETLEEQLHKGYITPAEMARATISATAAGRLSLRFAGSPPDMPFRPADPCTARSDHVARSAPPPASRMPDPPRSLAPIQFDRLAIAEKTRESARKSASEALAMRNESVCVGEGRKKLLEGLKYYYDSRGSAIATAASTKGAEARAEAERLWSSAQDQRIDRLVIEFIEAGYLQPSDFPAKRNPALASVYARAGAPGRACATTAAK